MKTSTILTWLLFFTLGCDNSRQEMRIVDNYESANIEKHKSRDSLIYVSTQALKEYKLDTITKDLKPVFGQTQSEKEIQKIVTSINLLKEKNKLQKLSSQGMSGCGGAVDGYYYRDKLVLIHSMYKAELGFSSRIMYLQDIVILKIIYREHVAEWGKYERNYPSDKFEWNPAKMTYTDTTYTITLGFAPTCIKTAKNKVISNQIDPKLINALVWCGQQMKKELEAVKNNH